MQRPTLRVWHDSGGKTFHYFAGTLTAAAEVLQALAEYDELAGRDTDGQGVEALEADGWVEWVDEDGRAIHAVIEAGDYVGR
jgi:hypothetical protein